MTNPNLQTLLERVRAALEPFARMAATFPDTVSDAIYVGHRSDGITVGTFRAAARAVAEMVTTAEAQAELSRMIARHRCDWPEDGQFTFRDDPGEHDPCYVVMPDGAMLALNHHAGEGVDTARARFIIDACNAALSDGDFATNGEGS
jgi:hypothetical protein